MCGGVRERRSVTGTLGKLLFLSARVKPPSDDYRQPRWQKLRQAEVTFEKETIENLLSKLTAEERELRKRLEDATDPHTKTPALLPTFTPLQPLNGKVLTNGIPTLKLNGDAGGKKGKKRKQEAY